MNKVAASLLLLLVSSSGYARDLCPKDQIQRDTVRAKQILSTELRENCKMEDAKKISDFYIGFSRKMDNCPLELVKETEPVLGQLAERIHQMTQNCN